MLTARGQKKDRDQAEAGGVSRFMTKPFANSEILAAVRELRRAAGMKRPAAPLFLARQTYRRRRLGDAARLLPLLGAVIFALPLLGAGGGRTTSGGGLFLFGGWALLILAAAAAGPGPARPRRRGGAGRRLMVSSKLLLAVSL